MSSYTHFTLEERKNLQELLAQGLRQNEIADILGRHPSSICREIRRNKARWKPHKKPNNPFWYNAWRAQNLYVERRRDQKRRALSPLSEEWNFILLGLHDYWSPEAICGRWSILHPDCKKLHFSTIYRYIKRGEFPKITPEKNLRRRGKKKQTRNANYNTIHPDRIIPQWPKVIKDRERLGDWEGDTVYGAVGKGLLVTLVDRKSRFLLAGLLSSRNAAETGAVMKRLLAHVPVHSISLDNGSEFSDFRDLEAELCTEVYFAQPHKPWQRGTNENTNDILRFFFPKGYDFHSLTEEQLQSVVASINNRPRKCLNWHTPYEAFSKIALA